MTDAQSTLPPPEDRPLVTFALFAYNQEKYIREAIEGAFAQTYEPLEIIISDDFSSDRTFEIMREMAASYKGPHQIRVVRNEHNLGPIDHVLARGREARGNIVVVAAGDDISNPNRTAKLAVAMLESERVFAADSLVDIVDENGALVAKNALRPLHLKAPNLFLKKSGANDAPLQGCAAAYRKEVFLIPTPEGRLEFAEDLLFSFFIRISGKKTIKVNESLLQYRRHERAISNKDPKRIKYENEEMDCVKSEEKRIQMLSTFKALSEISGAQEMVDHRSLDRELNMSLEILGWRYLGTFQRFFHLLKEVILRKNGLAKWMLFRTFGEFPRYQPKAMLVRFQKRYSP